MINSHIGTSNVRVQPIRALGFIQSKMGRSGVPPGGQKFSGLVAGSER
jgi:hypothetical protein